MRGLIRDGAVTACHDVSDGGVLVALAEMALASGIGAAVERPVEAPPAHAFWFGEDQGRYLVTVEGDGAALQDAANRAGVPVTVLGATGGDALTVDDASPISLQTLRDRHEGWLPAYMAGGAA